jgi:hypothetical protein
MLFQSRKSRYFATLEKRNKKNYDGSKKKDFELLRRLSQRAVVWLPISQMAMVRLPIAAAIAQPKKEEYIFYQGEKFRVEFYFSEARKI